MERGPECTKMSVSFSLLNGHIVEGIVVPILCHGDTLVHVHHGADNVGECDALVTENKQVALGIMTADCAPICFSDGERIGIAHIGWRGLCLGLIEKVLKEFEASHLEIFVGPHLHTFEIQKDSCYEAILEKFGERFLEEEREKIIFHFKDAIASLLPQSAQFDTRSTGKDATLPSYRRDRTSKRLVTMVQFRNN